MVPGAISLNRPRPKPIGEHLPDPFFDSYREEALECTDIMNLMDRAEGNFVRIKFAKPFLKKVVHSYIVHIKRLEGDIQGRVYEH